MKKSNKVKAQTELKEILDQQEKLRRAEQLRQQQAEELRRQTELLRLNREREAELLEEHQERQRTVEENLQQQDDYEQQSQQARQEIASKDLTALQNNTGASPAQIAAGAAVTVAVAQNLTSNPAAKNLYNQDPHKAKTQSNTTPPIGQDPAKTIAKDPHALAVTETNHPEIKPQKQVSVTVNASIKDEDGHTIPTDHYIKPEITAETIKAAQAHGTTASAVNPATADTKQPGLDQQPGLYIQAIHATPSS